MQATPATWRLLMSSGWEGDANFKILCGGETMSATLAEQLLTCSGELWNMYGPTETTVWSTCQLITAPSQSNYIGSPIDNTQLYILDEQLNPVPHGAPGELYIGGMGVADGYLNRDELTKQLFVKNRYSQNLHHTMYKTGDLVSFSAQGNLRYLSRIDTQVKVRGFRIELGEIEQAISQIPTVKQVAVVLAGSDPADQRLLAFCVPAKGCMVNAGELRKILLLHLPKHMIPQFFISIDEMPLTPNGKLDRKALALRTPIQEESTDIVLPTTAAEKYLAKVWSETLKVGQLGVDANFFDMGGHSLLSMEVIARIRRELGVAVSVRDMVFSSLGIIAVALSGYIDEEQINDTERADRPGMAGLANSEKATRESFYSRLLQMFGRELK